MATGTYRSSTLNPAQHGIYEVLPYHPFPLDTAPEWQGGATERATPSKTTRKPFFLPIIEPA
jgi:hypothetical protein